MRLSELIVRLLHTLETHGDVEVYSGGEDYPGRVVDAVVQNVDDPYVPRGAVNIRAGGVL